MIGNGTEAAKPIKRRTRGPNKPKPVLDQPKRNLPPLDPFAAQAEADAHFAEGNRKLTMAVDALRSGLETIVIAEVDRMTGLPTTALDLRKLAVEALDSYSQITGQNWRRAKLTGPTRAGDRNRGSLQADGYDDHE
jgi:hypothetical protein